jgi:hypothetical protein
VLKAGVDCSAEKGRVIGAAKAKDDSLRFDPRGWQNQEGQEQPIT